MMKKVALILITAATAAMTSELAWAEEPAWGLFAGIVTVTGWEGGGRQVSGYGAYITRDIDGNVSISARRRIDMPATDGHCCGAHDIAETVEAGLHRTKPAAWRWAVNPLGEQSNLWNSTGTSSAARCADYAWEWSGAPRLTWSVDRMGVKSWTKDAWVTLTVDEVRGCYLVVIGPGGGAPYVSE